MKITVDRKQSSDELVFTITVKNVEPVPFTEEDLSTFDVLDAFSQSIERSLEDQNKDKEFPKNMLSEQLANEALNALHSIKSKTFTRMQNKLKFNIKNDVECKIGHICQEVYNFIYDLQAPSLKRFMYEFDPQRTKYYFDNDKSISECMEKDDE